MPSTSITCPFCGQAIEVVLDDTEGEQSLITDCEVCCRPMEVRATIENHEISWVVEN